MRKLSIAFLLFLIATSQTFSQTIIDLPDSISIRTESLLRLKTEMETGVYIPTDYVVDTLEVDPLAMEINYTNLAGIGAIALGAGTIVHFYQANAWWKDQRTAFHFQNDWDYALWVDKIGHFYGAHILSHFFAVGMEASNFDPGDAALYSSIAAFAFQLYVEIEDGFGAQWGFSPGDATGDFLGAAYSFSQYQFPVLKNFNLKASYYPSEEYRNGQHNDGNTFDDYEGQKFWISFKMKELLPKSIAKYWPAILQLAAGYGVKNLDGSGGGTKEFYIAFDLDLEEIPLYGKFWQFWKSTLNYFHMPMPGIRISPNTAIFGLCF
ncbi:MAG: DUF2279 domain-containing protein [bacterium]